MQRFPTVVCRTVALCAVTVLWPLAHAQTMVFKNFKHYPASGQWQQELVGYRDNKALGPPVTTTTCSSPLDAKTASGLGAAMKGVAQMCTTTVLVDQERLAEAETVCKVGAGVQTLHTQLRAMDDKTIISETRSTMAGYAGTVMKNKVTYLGACPAEAAAAQIRQKAGDCAELARMRQDNEAAGGVAQCAQLPAQYRAQCEAGPKMLATLEQQCK